MDKSNKKGKETPKLSADSAKPKTKQEGMTPALKPKDGNLKDTGGGVQNWVKKLKKTLEEKGSFPADGTVDFTSETGSIKERRLSDSSLKGVSWVTSESNEEKGQLHEPVRRARSNTTNKEMWVPLAIQDVNGEDKEAPNLAKKTNSHDPVKPPRPKRVSSFKHTSGKDEKVDIKMRKTKKNETNPVKPPRRKLPRTPAADTKFQKGEKHKDSQEELSESERESRDIISKPVVMSTPFQENMTLSVEDVADDDKGRRLFSIYDDSTDTTVQQGQSFYDFLYSEEGKGTKETGAYSDNQVRDLRDENLYDDVPLDSSTQSLASIGRRTDTDFDIYDEVIVNKENYLMPVDNDEDMSDTDPWGSDFDDDDDDDFEDLGDHDNDMKKVDDDGDDDYDDESGSGYEEYEERRNTSSVFYFDKTSKRPDAPLPRNGPSKAKADSPFHTKKVNISIPGFKGIKGCFGISKAASLPYLATDGAKSVEQDEEEPDYVDPNIADTENYQQPVMPVMPSGLTSVQIKRYQIVKFILESEADYMKLMDSLIKKYELPIRERDLLESSKVDIIFQGIHKVLECHVMFNIALSARMNEWNTEEMIGDILYALFSKSMVLEAYSEYVNNFAKAMDTIKSACKTHLAFAQLLKARRQSCRERTTLHSLMLKPTKRFPQFIDLVQELLKVTPVEHPDRIPLQMALTQLEYLADNLNERKREADLRLKVKQLDASTAHISKPLSSGNRYFIRQDDFVQCVIEDDTIVRTKRRRLIMLSDMLLCISPIKGKKDRVANLITDVRAKYKLKWNVPLSDVEVIEYGPGITIYASPQRTTVTQTKGGQYRQQTGCQEHFADLQHDLAIIGQIAGLVATLRRSYQILDNDKVQKWHKAVQRTIEEETRLANLYWLELSLPAKTGRVNYIFSTDSPTVKADWLTALNTAILRLSPENNPGWYLPEDDGTGGVAVQRRSMPLLKDNTDLFLLNPKARVQGIISCPDASDPLPGIHDNYNNLWLLCGGGDSVGFVNVVSVSSSSSPKIVESFHVCDSQIMCGEFVKRTCGEDKKITGPISGKFGFPFPTVWLGAQSGKIYIYNGVDSERRYVMSVKLPDAVLSLKAIKRKVFASLADGSVVVFKPNQDGIWDFSKPKAIGLSKLPVMSMALVTVTKTLWCGSGNQIHVLDYKKEVVKNVIDVDPSSKVTVRHLVCYGIGVWVSLWKQPTIKLFHSETMKHVQDMNIAYTVNTMQNDIDSQLEKIKLNKLCVSCMVAEEGLLWVGTSVGLVLIFPLPRLDGIPLVSGRACVSFHAYQGRVRSMFPLKNNPDAEIPIGPGPGKKKRYQLFREHETRDACVQTDAGVSGISSYAANGPEPAISGTSNQSMSSHRSLKQRESESKTSRADPECDEDEDIHSDDEFSFVEDEKNYHPPGKTLTSSPNFSVRIGNDQDRGEVTSIGNIANQIPDLGDTDFVQLMEDFKGFGTSPNASVPAPPDVSAVLITGSISKELNKTEDTVPTNSETTKLEDGDVISVSAVSSDKTVAGSPAADFSNTTYGLTPGCSTFGEQSAEFRARVPSKGQYVTLSEAQKEANAIGKALDSAKTTEKESNPEEDIKAVDDALEAAFDADLDDTENTTSIPRDVTSESLEKTAEYVSFLNSPPSQSKIPDSDSDSDNESMTKKRDSYSIFSAGSGDVQSPGDEGKKVVNLKPKLTYPVFLVTAGEGHLDQRRKKQDPKSSEPRIMIWQIS